MAQKIIQRQPLTTGIPLIAIRYDDGSWCQIDNIKEWLRRQIPVTMAINWNNLRDGGPLDPGGPYTPMRKADLIGLLEFAEKHNTRLEFVQHGNTNMEGWLDDGGWDELLAELDTSQIAAETGQTEFGFIEPGNTEQLTRAQYNAFFLLSALRESGIVWAQGIFDYFNDNELDGDTLSLAGMFTNGDFLYGNPSAITNGVQAAVGGLVPDRSIDPYSLPRPTTIDLGSYFVVRGMSDGEGGWLESPGSGVAPWALGADNNGLGAEGGSVTADLEYIAQWFICRALGLGLWSMYGFHGDVRSDTAVISKLSAGRGSSGTPAALPGHFSSPYLAWFFDKLRDKGHCRMGTANDWAREVVSGFAEGTDVVENPELAMPFYDIGAREDALPDLPFVRGFSLKGVGSTSQSRLSFPVRMGSNPDSDGRYSPDPTSFMGANEVGYLGRPGGITLRKNGDTETYEVAMGRAGLASGLYRVSFNVHGYSGTSAAFTVRSVQALGFRTRFRSEDAFESGLTEVLPEFHVLRSSDVFKQMSGRAAGSRIVLHLDLPSVAAPHATAAATGAVTNLADDDEVTVGTVTIAGAHQGANAFAFPETVALPAGVTVRASITGRDTVAIIVRNTSGSPVSIGIAETRWIAVVEKLMTEDVGLQNFGPAQPWRWTWVLRGQADNTTPRTISDYRCELLKLY